MEDTDQSSSSTVESAHFNDGDYSNKSRRDHDELILSNKKRSKKLRAVKLSKSPSLKASSARKSRTHFRDMAVVDSPSDVEIPNSSSSSSQRSTLSKKPEPVLTKRLSFNKGVKVLTRVSSKRQKKLVTTKITRSTRPVNSSPRYDQISLDSSSSSSKSLKASPRSSEHSFSSDRKSSLSPLRVSAKKKRDPVMKNSEMSHPNDPGIERPTCSSALRDSKMANSVQIHHCEIESDEANSDTKVCPFSYCSLHGHRHKEAPPLKRLISIRRRLLRNDRNVKVETRKDKPNRVSNNTNANNNNNNKVSIGVQTDLVEDFDCESSFEADTSAEEEVKISDSSSSSCVEEILNRDGDSELIVQKGRDSKEEEKLPDREEKENLEPGRDSEEEEEKQPNKEEKENLEPSRESDPRTPVDNMSPRMKLKDHKYVKMWRLMYKHAVEEVENKKDEGEQEQEEKEVEERVLPEDNQAKVDAVNLVQKAFDEILLPEVQVHQEHAAVGEEEKSPEQKVSNSWSSLKKIFILKRFVKAVEKVKMIKKGTPRFLPLQTEPEAERVNLRSQTTEEKKNSEDWMLDYALQQVVSKLDPDQQRQVAMLVKAFETVLPDLNSSSPSPSPRLSVQSRSLVDQSVGTEESLRNVLVRRLFPKGQSLETDSQQQQDLNSPFPGNIDDRKSRGISLLGNRLGSLDGKKKPNGTELLDAKKPESETLSRSLDAAKDTQLERQSYMRLWGFVYQHMMTSIPAEDGTKQSDDNVKTELKKSGDDDDAADEGNQKALIRRLDAIKLIEKAIDDVILPDSQDSPSPTETPSAGSDDEPQAKNTVETPSIGNDDDDENQGNNSSSTTAKCTEEVKKNSAVPERQLSNNWSNLKKKILLRRFIKAFDNARKFNPREPRFLAPEAEPEAEKVNLRHQEMDGRKRAEEWMVDHALQQAVARLTPARMKKVQLLVEAFETVTPAVRA